MAPVRSAQPSAVPRIKVQAQPSTKNQLSFHKTTLKRTNELKELVNAVNSKKAKGSVFSVRDLPDTDCSSHLQRGLDSLFKTRHSVTVKEIHSETVGYFDHNDGEEWKYILDNADLDLGKFSYRYRQFVVSQKQEGEDVLFLIFTVKEYQDVGCATIDYFDTLFYYKPYGTDITKTHVYNTIVDSYCDYAASMGFERCQIIVSAPPNGGSYFFNRRPQAMHTLEQKKLMEWWKNIFKNCDSVESCNKELPACFGECETVEEFLRRLFVSDFSRDWFFSLLNTSCLQTEDKDKLLTDLKRKTKLAMKRSTNEHFFIKLVKKEGDSELSNQKNMFHEFTMTRDVWMEYLEENNLEFSTIEKAKESTAKIVDALLLDTQ